MFYHVPLIPFNAERQTGSPGQHFASSIPGQKRLWQAALKPLLALFHDNVFIKTSSNKQPKNFELIEEVITMQRSHLGRANRRTCNGAMSPLGSFVKKSRSFIYIYPISLKVSPLWTLAVSSNASRSIFRNWGSSFNADYIGLASSYQSSKQSFVFGGRLNMGFLAAPKGDVRRFSGRWYRDPGWHGTGCSRWR